MYHILVIHGWLIIWTNVTINLPAGQQDILDFCFCITNDLIIIINKLIGQCIVNVVQPLPSQRIDNLTTTIQCINWYHFLYINSSH